MLVLIIISLDRFSASFNPLNSFPFLSLSFSRSRSFTHYPSKIYFVLDTAPLRYIYIDWICGQWMESVDFDYGHVVANKELRNRSFFDPRKSARYFRADYIRDVFNSCCLCRVCESTIAFMPNRRFMPDGYLFPKLISFIARAHHSLETCLRIVPYNYFASSARDLWTTWHGRVKLVNSSPHNSR